MSIADIFKIQTAYNTNGTFNDQTNWQDAFNIANAFNESASLGAKARDDWRKYYFNEAVQETGIDAQNALNRNTINKADWETAFRNATEQNRINYTNWDYGNKQQVGNLKVADLQRLYNNALQTDPSQIESTIAQNQANTEKQHLAFNTAQAQNQLANFYAKNYFDPTIGGYRSPEDLRSLYAQNPSGLNNHAVMALDEANRNYLIGTGKNLAPISPMMGSTYTAMATGSPFIVDEQGNLINYQTGTLLGKIDSPTLQMQFAGGDAYKGFSEMLKAQQEAEKAKLVAEARNPYVLEQIQARSDAAQAKQNNWIQYQDEKALKKTVDGLIDTILMNSNFNETKNIDELLSQANQVLAKSDPNLRPLILDRLRAVSEAQGIMYPPVPSN